jgi:regulator of protease activity HflC (stomatin/prohibitin superfamily)
MQFILLAILVFVVLLAIRGIQVIRQAEIMIVERLGKYHRTLQPGFNIIWPFIDRGRSIAWRGSSIDSKGRRMTRTVIAVRVDLREQVFDFPEQNVITRDNVVIEVNGLLYYQITDGVRAVYEVANLPRAIEKLAQTTLRNIIGELDLDGTLSSRDEINSKMRLVLDEATDKWGVKVNRVELQDINPPKQVQETMELQMTAERERRARILEAEGIKRSQVLKAEGHRDAEIATAEGDKKARVLRAEGEAEGLRKVTEALAEQSTDSAQYQVALAYLQTLEKLAANAKGDKTVFLPYESATMLSSIGSVKELLSAVGGSSASGGASPPPLPPA